jgi:hypothetical protein
MSLGRVKAISSDSELVNDESCACDLGAATSHGRVMILHGPTPRVLTIVGLREHSIGLSTEWRARSKEARHAERRSFEGIA